MIEIKDVTEGKLNNQIVWICDYRYNNYGEKAIRKITPKKVLIRDNSETKKRIYYSKSHFIALNKKDEPLKSKVYGVYDNTGYRSFPGVPLNCFKTEKECIAHYNTLLKTVSDGFKNYKESIIKSVDSKMDEIDYESIVFTNRLNNLK